MATEELSIVEKTQLLSDIELAALLCMTTSQHCLIDASDETIDDVAREISLVDTQNLTQFLSSRGANRNRPAIKSSG